AAMSLGIARRALEIMNRYAEERNAFGNSLNRFGQIQRHIAESYVDYKAARSYLYDVARRLKLDEEGHRIDSDGVKLFAATMAKNV
ncbi:isovaleryl-CoA dehydrogenase, partial [Pseudomonas sp. FW305-20]|uniref:acyl-CoA dehydrogenase family protein n=1 Tax=Pseudomonas sp. FW305-20 TaxID=2070560 RepID=UPI000CB2DC05